MTDLTIRTKRENATEIATVGRTFADCFDKKGRTVGARVYLQEMDFVDQTEADHGALSYGVKAGHYFAARPTALRGGGSFGAWQGERTFITEDARDEWVSSYFKNAEKRARKNFSARG
jgi:hypothetical protein